MDLGKAAGAPVFVEIAGKRYRAKPQTLRMLAELTSWAQSKLTNPMLGVAELLESPPSRKREREATAAMLALQDAERLALKADADRAKVEGREPNPDAALQTVDADLRVRGEEARAWMRSKEALEAQSYHDMHAPPQLGNVKLNQIVYGVEGSAYGLWLGLTAIPENRETWPDYLAVLDVYQRHGIRDLIDCYESYLGFTNADPLTQKKRRAASGGDDDWTSLIHEMFKEKDALPDTWLDLTRPQFDALFDGDSDTDERVITSPSPEQIDDLVRKAATAKTERQQDITVIMDSLRHRLRAECADNRHWR